jgi:hypothetical protein
MKLNEKVKVNMKYEKRRIRERGREKMSRRGDESVRRRRRRRISKMIYVKIEQEEVRREEEGGEG